MAVTGQILRSYRAPRAVLRAQLAQPWHEGRALIYLVLACGLALVAQIPRLLHEARLPEAPPFEGLFAGTLFATMFVAPLFFYGISLALGVVLRLVRPGLAFYPVRLALFWALLAVSPLVLAQSALVAVVGGGGLALLLGLVVLVVFLVVLAGGLGAALEGASRAA